MTLLALLLGGGLLSAIWGLWLNYKQMKQKAAQAEAQAVVKTDLEKVAEDAVKVKETVRDYSTARDEFLKNNPDKS